MADNVVLNAGTGGSTVATDDIGGIHYPRSKMSLGADGAATDALGGAGAVAAGVQRVTLASDDPAVALLTTMDVDTGNAATALQVMGDWDESDRAKVNPIVGQAGVAAGAGAVGVTVQRVTLASDDPAVVSLQLLDNVIAGSEMQVDIVGGGIVGAVHDAAVAAEGIQQMLSAVAADPTAVTAADAVRAIATLLGKQIVLPYAIPASTWSYASPAAVTDTADDAAKAAAGAGIRNYITSAQIFNADDSVGTEVVIKDGSTVLFRGWAEQTGGGLTCKFDPPLRGTANTAVNVANITTSAETYFNLQGFTAAE